MPDMKSISLLLVLLLSSFANGQYWEITAAPAGLSNYQSWLKDRQVHVKAYQYSFFISGFRRFVPNNPGRGGKVQWFTGIGISYGFHQAHWEYKNNNGVYQPTTISVYDLDVGVLSAELTPLILEFQQGLEFRSGLLAGVVLNRASNFPEERIRRLNLQFSNRLSYRFQGERLHWLPFYQFSTGLIREVTSGQFERLLLQRHHIGVTVQLQASQ
jgi:hypothetical protein